MNDRELLELILARFDTVEARLDKIEARLDGMDARFDTVEARLDGMDARFDTVEARLDGMQDDITIIKKDVKDVKAHVKFNRKSDIDIIDYIDKRIDEKIERAMNSRKTA